MAASLQRWSTPHPETRKHFFRRTLTIYGEFAASFFRAWLPHRLKHILPPLPAGEGGGGVRRDARGLPRVTRRRPRARSMCIP